MDNQMHVFFETEAVTMQVEENDTLFRLTFTEKYNNENISDEDYKQYLTIYADKVLALKPKKLIIDMQASTYTVVPDLQKWTADEISPKTLCLEKIAYILSYDIFSATASEQMMNEEGIQEYYQTRYFNNLQEAESWLSE